MSDLLNDNSAAYLKNYGPGELSIISLRGGSAYHTTILWNGFSLANPMHGLTDLSLEKNFLFDNINIEYGGTSAVWGSGAVSGSVLLNNKPSFNSGLKIITGITAGSFSNYSQFGGIIWGTNKYSGTLKFFNQSDANNFNYYDENIKSTTKQVHAKINQFGIMNENYFRIGNFSTLNLRIWITNCNRQIPLSIQQVNSNPIQKDINQRYSVEWKHQKNKIEYVLRSAYFNEKLNYNDDLIYLTSNNKSKTIITEATFEKFISANHILQFGINNNYSETDSSANFNKVSVNRIAAYLLYRYHSNNDKIDVSVNGRKEFSSLNNSPILLSGGLNYYPIKFLQVRFSASTVYRNPTLNDLYWIPGGNVDLKPENGYSSEAGIQINFSELPGLKNKFPASKLIFNATIYYKEINNWIIWYPSTSLIWSPQNLMMVQSYGTELNLQYRYQKNNITAGCEFEYFYTISTNEKPLLINDASLNNQLIYVPLHRWTCTIFINYKTYGFRFNQSYTSKRYTTSDNSSYLTPYSLGNLEANKIFLQKSYSFRLFVRINNLFNTNYQSILNRPMPLQSIETGLTFMFKKK